MYCVFLSPPPGVSTAPADPPSKPSVSKIFETLEYGPAPESPSVANAWLEDHGRSFGHFISNQWVKPQGRKTYDTMNPATGQKLATTVQGECWVVFMWLVSYTIESKYRTG